MWTFDTNDGDEIHLRIAMRTEGVQETETVEFGHLRVKEFDAGEFLRFTSETDPELIEEIWKGGAQISVEVRPDGADEPVSYAGLVADTPGVLRLG